MKSATKYKLKFNRVTYKRYEFNVRIDSVLNAIIERFKQKPNNNFSDLIKSCLCQYFGLTRDEADDLYVHNYYDKDGKHILIHNLDKYFK